MENLNSIEFIKVNPYDLQGQTVMHSCDPGSSNLFKNIQLVQLIWDDIRPG